MIDHFHERATISLINVNDISTIKAAGERLQAVYKGTDPTNNTWDRRTADDGFCGRKQAEEGRRTKFSGLITSGGTAATSVYYFQGEVACRPGAPRPLEVRLPWSGALRFHEVRLAAGKLMPTF